MKALNKTDDPSRASIPFDAERAGFVLGEGSGILIIEELEHAKARGAKIYFEIVGYGANCDAYHITAPNPEGDAAAKCMEIAVKDAGILPTDVDYINAHGTSTHLNDDCETKAIKKAFGDHAYKLMISSTKSMTGHLLGGAGRGNMPRHMQGRRKGIYSGGRNCGKMAEAQRHSPGLP